jgi:hypothetical protein
MKGRVGWGERSDAQRLWGLRSLLGIAALTRAYVEHNLRGEQVEEIAALAALNSLHPPFALSVAA